MNKIFEDLCLGGLGEFCNVLASSETIDIFLDTIFPEIKDQEILNIQKLYDNITTTWKQTTIHWTVVTHH